MYEYIKYFSLKDWSEKNFNSEKDKKYVFGVASALIWTPSSGEFKPLVRHCMYKTKMAKDAP